MPSGVRHEIPADGLLTKDKRIQSLQFRQIFLKSHATAVFMNDLSEA